MGRDKVLGLSLAILVIGIAAAFCFRNEPIVESGLKLARASVLDEAISKLPGPKPYTQEAKREKPKATLPTVTLNGIESVDPFADRPASAPAERDKNPKLTAKANLPTIKLAAADKTTIPPQMPAIDTHPTSDEATASIDTVKASPEINTSKPSAAPVFPSENPTNDPSTLLTSTAPPIANPPAGDADSSVGEIVIRPNAPSSSRAETVKEQNVAWQSKGVKQKHETLADNSPRIEPATSDSNGDDPHRNECTRDNPTRDIPGLTPPKSEDAAANPIRDTPAGIDQPPSERVTVTPQGDPSSQETDGASKPIMHRVRRGDMLTKIALHYLGDSRRYREIFEANRDQLRTPNDRLKIGMMLRIPANTAKPAHHDRTIAKRKTRSRTSHSSIGTTGTSKVPIHNAARLREKPPSEPIGEPPAPMTGDQGINTDNSTTNRFVPVRRAPFLPGTKSKSDQASPGDKPDEMNPATSSRDVPKKDPITLAGDREDATIR